MKIILIFFIISNFILCDGIIWLSIGNSGDYKVSSIYGFLKEDNLKKSGIELGYDYIFKKINKLSFGSGIAFLYKPMVYKEYYTNIEVGLLSFYGFGNYWFNDKIAAKINLGIVFPSHDAKNADRGTIYSLGFIYRINKKLFLGLSYKINNLSDDFSDWKFSRLTFDIGSYNF